MEQQDQLTPALIKQYLCANGSQLKSETILKAQEFLKDFEITLLGFLGAGAFGTVLKAQDGVNKRSVAVKIMICQDANMVTDCLQEFQKMKIIKSPYTVTSYDIFYDETNEQIYMVTEYVPKGDLSSYISENKSLSPKQIIDLFVGILEGLKAMHSKNIIHADLKPQNILLTEDNTPKICDFGMSKKLINKSHTSNKGLTAAYASKEQIEGILCKESDIFAAGAILCQMCGLQFVDNVLLCFAMKEDKFPDISNHAQKSLLQIAFKMMNSDFQRRSTIDEVKEMLSLYKLNAEKDEMKEANTKKVEPNQTTKQILANGFQTIVQVDGSRHEGEYKNGLKHGKGKSFFSNGDIIDGEWRDGKLNGHGQYKSADGSCYVGEFKDGLFNGKGKSIMNSGDTYEGEYLNHDYLKGTYIYSADGNIYEGEFKKERRHGKGRMFFANGDFYEGDWRDNIPSGYGELAIKSDGSKYIGEILNSLKHGKGKIVFSDGSSYDGEFKNGKKNGKGIISKGGRSYDGGWIDDIMHGYGKFTNDDGTVLEGEFRNNSVNGKGKVTTLDGILREGNFVGSKMNGLGKVTISNGERIEVEFKDDKMCGKGKHFYKNGDVFEGIWRDNKKNGQGKLTTAEGKVTQGMWIDDVFLKK